MNENYTVFNIRNIKKFAATTITDSQNCNLKFYVL